MRKLRVPAQGIVDVVVRTDRGLSIRGHVVAPTREPIADMNVRATLLGADWSESTASNGDGSFVLGPLVGGEYELTAFQTPPGGHDPTTGTWRRATYAPSAPLRVKAGDQAVVLPLHVGGSIHCTYVLDSGVSLGSAWDSADRIWVEIRDLTRGFMGGVDDGGVSAPLAPGTYTVVASSTSGLCGMAGGIEVRDGAVREVALVIGRGARLRVHAKPGVGGGAGVDQYEVYSDNIRIASRRMNLSTPVTHSVPAGHVVIRAHTTTGVWNEQPIDVSAGETRELAVKP